MINFDSEGSRERFFACADSDKRAKKPDFREKRAAIACEYAGPGVFWHAWSEENIQGLQKSVDDCSESLIGRVYALPGVF